MNDDGPESKLGALLQPHLGAFATPAVESEPPPSRRRLDERELMALIFEGLDADNPRVCEGIDFSCLDILLEAANDDRRDDDEPDDEPDDEMPATEPKPNGGPSSATPSPFAPRLDAQTWVGAGWSDDIAAVPAEWLERPRPSAAQLELLAATRERRLSSIELRRFDRRSALRHLELFVHACVKNGDRLCRVIPGKGVESRGEPVLKRAVLEWCRGPGRAAVGEWAPELDQYGEWGSMILRLRKPR